MCETQSHNDVIFSNMQHSLQALSHQLEPTTAIFPQLQQKLHEPPIKNTDLGQFITLQQLSTFSSAFQEAEQRIFQLSGDSTNFSHFSAQNNDSFAPRTYGQQLEERLFRLELKSSHCGEIPAEIANFQTQIANIASMIENLQQQRQNDTMEIRTAIADLKNRNASTRAPTTDISGLKATMSDLHKQLQQDVCNIEASLAKLHTRYAEVAGRIPDVTGIHTAIENLHKPMQEMSTKTLQVQSPP